MKTTNVSPAAPVRNIFELQKEAWGDVDVRDSFEKVAAQVNS